MATFLRPDADVAAGAWTTTPLWLSLDEAVASDADFVTSNNNTNPDTFEVGLTAPAGTPGAGTRTLRVRLSKSATGGHALQERVGLYQGGTLVQELLQATPDSTAWRAVPLTITNPITDWSDLRVRVSREGDTGGPGGNRRSLRCSFIELEVPDSGITKSGSAAISGGGTIAATGEKRGKGSAAVSGGGQVVAAGDTRRFGSLVLGGGGTITVTGEAAGGDSRSGAIVLSGGGTVAATGAKRARGAAGIAGGGAVQASGSSRRSGAVSVSGGGSVAMSGESARFGAALLSGGGVLTTAGLKRAQGVVELHGGGTITTDGEVAGAAPSGDVAISGGGQLQLQGHKRVAGAVAVSAGGALEAEGLSRRSGAVSVTGGGQVSVTVGRTSRSGSVTLSGGGVVTVQGGTAAAVPTWTATLERMPRPVGSLEWVNPVVGFMEEVE